MTTFDPNGDVWRERRSRERLSRPLSEYRDDFDRDRARVIHSAAFRRLQAKTQVLGIGEGDFHRTRLTHSMEAAQVARGIVRFAVQMARKGGGIPEWRNWLPNPNLIETIALAHDLGHPPFGHGGEVALNFAMRDAGGFEGNGQTLRLLARLESHTENFGLDLTRRTLLGLLKYPVVYEKVVKTDIVEIKDLVKLRREDWKPPKCYMSSESPIVTWLLKPFPRLDRVKFTSLVSKPTETSHGKSKYHCFDTAFMELADDIAYGVHDFEDAIALRLVTVSDWKQASQGLDGAWARRVGIAPIKKITDALFGALSHSRKRAIGCLVNAFIVSTEIFEHAEFAHPLLRYQARLSKPARSFLDALQELIRNKVIRTAQVQTLEYRGQQFIVRLFDAIASDPPRLLKEGFAKTYSAANSKRAKRRVIGDYIAGMTDEYATRIYERLFVPRQGHVFDRL